MSTASASIHAATSAIERLGHRRALQVEDVGICEQQRCAREAGLDRSGRALDQPGEGPRGDGHAQDRNRDRERARLVEDVDLRRHHAEQVGQWQPHGADLLPSRKQAVEHTPRHDEVRARVVVAERETEVRIVESRGAAAEKDHRGGE
jgi:hypothetical protein